MQILSEIREQPALLAGILTREQPAVHRLARSLRQRRPPFAMIVARGTSDNAAVYGKYVLESLARLPVALAAPSLYTLYNAPPDLSSSCVLALSQSGQSPDLVAVLTEARRQGALTAAVVNQQESPLAEAAEHVLWCGAGLERTVAATKSYTAELLLLAMLAIALAEDANLAAQLPAVPKAVASVLHLEDQIASLATAWRSIDRCVVLGRGYAFATALETALKIKETSYVVADAYSGADFLHGPIALVDQGFPALLFATNGPTIPSMVALADTLRERGATTLAFTDSQQVAAAATASVVTSADLPDVLSPLSQVVLGQFFASYLAKAKGFDPDQPRGLHKVTETR